MTHAAIKLRQVGGSTGAIFPKEFLEEIHAGTGDTLHLIRTERGTYELSPFDPDFEDAMAAYREVSREYRDALRELAR
jgi:antitoxin MazE